MGNFAFITFFLSALPLPSAIDGSIYYHNHNLKFSQLQRRHYVISIFCISPIEQLIYIT